MRTIQVQSNRPTLIDIYSNLNSNQPNTELFLHLMRKPKNLERVASKMPRLNELTLYRGQVVAQNPNLKMYPLSELMMTEAFLRVGVRTIYEAVYFNLTRKGLMYHPDIWTNIYLKEKDEKKMLLMEPHPFGKIGRMERARAENLIQLGKIRNEDRKEVYEWIRNKEVTTVNKMSAMHVAHPELYFIVRSDMSVENFKSEFGISDINLVCDEYISAKGFSGLDTEAKFHTRMQELKVEMKQLKKRPHTRLEKDREKWHNDVSMIIKEEIVKALR